MSLPSASNNIHATCVAIGTRGILLLGLSGTGKSDLALRLIDRGATLVADDRCDISAERDRLICAPPAALAGKIEVRGIGIVERPWVAPMPVVLAVRLSERYERLPEKGREMIGGIAVPVIKIAPFEQSAAIKVELALGHLIDAHGA